MVEPLRHRQTKEAETDMSDLQQPRHIPTLPRTTYWPWPPNVGFSSDSRRIAALPRTAGWGQNRKSWPLFEAPELG
jgi:hypothetical protein